MWWSFTTVAEHWNISSHATWTLIYNKYGSFTDMLIWMTTVCGGKFNTFPFALGPFESCSKDIHTFIGEIYISYSCLYFKEDVTFDYFQLTASPPEAQVPKHLCLCACPGTVAWLKLLSFRACAKGNFYVISLFYNKVFQILLNVHLLTTPEGKSGVYG